MQNINKIIKSTMASVLAVTTVSTLTATNNVMAATQKIEKCYGITKAGMNDCATSTAACAGSAKQDKQTDAFIFLPKGVCEKIVGGNLKSIPDKK